MRTHVRHTGAHFTGSKVPIPTRHVSRRSSDITHDPPSHTSPHDNLSYRHVHPSTDRTRLVRTPTRSVSRSGTVTTLSRPPVTTPLSRPLVTTPCHDPLSRSLLHMFKISSDTPDLGAIKLLSIKFVSTVTFSSALHIASSFGYNSFN